METTIRIDGRDVRFKATAATPMLYRGRFNRDLLRDLQGLAAEMQRGRDADGSLPIQVLETFERMAYIMAKQADPDGAPDSPEEWIDGFSVMPFYALFPVLLDLWSGNVEGLEESKKKAGLWIENLQRLSSSFGRSASASPSETWTG